MSSKISWTRDWDTQDYTGFSPKQIRNAKRIYKKLAVIVIKAQIKKLRKKITYTTSWKNDKGIYLFNTYITPPATPPKPNTKGGTINPPPPPQP